ncbi:MAG TPA: ankyrin repeat domain-containing protein [Gemmatimonadales bacterium]|nr:ankyrin repeat domain-containing protein [Gemmatimonadales bacterium]
MTALMVIAGWPGEERFTGVELLLKAGAKVNAVDEGGQTVLRVAAYRRDARLVRALLAANARVEVGTPLHDAISAASLQRPGDLDGTVEALLGAGASVEKCDRHGRRALQLAARRGQERVVKMLLAAGADPEAPDPNSGDPPLHAAAANGTLSVVRALLKAEAPVDARNPYDCSTALHRAAAAGQRESVEALLAAGSAVNPTDRNGETPLELSEQRGHPRAADLLRRSGGRHATLPTASCESQAAKERRPCVRETEAKKPQAAVDGDFEGALRRVAEEVTFWEASHRVLVAQEIVLEIQSNLAYAAGMLCVGSGPKAVGAGRTPCQKLMGGGEGLRSSVWQFLSETLLAKESKVDSPFSRFAAALGVNAEAEMGYPSAQPNRYSCVQVPSAGRVKLPTLGGTRVSPQPVSRVCMLPGDYELEVAPAGSPATTYRLSAGLRQARLEKIASPSARATSVLPALGFYCPDPDGGVQHPMAKWAGRDAPVPPTGGAVPFSQSPIGKVEIVDSLGKCSAACRQALTLSLVQSIQLWLGACETCSPSSLRALDVGGKVFLDRVLLDRLLLAADIAAALESPTPIMEEGSLHMNRFSVAGPRPRKPFPPYVEITTGSELASTLCRRLNTAGPGVPASLRSLLCGAQGVAAGESTPLRLEIVTQATCAPDAIACATVQRGLTLSAGSYVFRPPPEFSSDSMASGRLGKERKEVNLLTVLNHEVGHWFGLPHLDDPRPTPDGRINAMYPNLSDAGHCLTTANLQMLANAGRPDWYYRQKDCAGMRPGGRER